LLTQKWRSLVFWDDRNRVSFRNLGLDGKIVIETRFILLGAIAFSCGDRNRVSFFNLGVNAQKVN
jgi:hypothetical protein